MKNPKGFAFYRIENMKTQDCIKQATLFNGAQKYEQYIEKYER